jgi:hypothetical protein
MPASFINDPAHWRQRAAEARSVAEQMNDPQSKEAMLRIAKDYERLAERAAQRAIPAAHSWEAAEHGSGPV